eukprot:75776-Chlamydomonas_euryale.AAC.2
MHPSVAACARAVQVAKRLLLLYLHEADDSPGHTTPDCLGSFTVCGRWAWCSCWAGSLCVHAMPRHCLCVVGRGLRSAWYGGGCRPRQGDRWRRRQAHRWCRRQGDR